MDRNKSYNIKKISHLLLNRDCIILDDFSLRYSVSGGYVLMKFDILDASCSHLPICSPIAQFFFKN